MVQERQEVSIPQSVLGRVTRAASRTGKSRQDVTQFLGGDDLEVEAQKRLDEAVFHSLAVVDAGVGLGQTADEQALVCTEHPVIQLDLKKEESNWLHHRVKSQSKHPHPWVTTLGVKGQRGQRSSHDNREK